MNFPGADPGDIRWIRDDASPSVRRWYPGACRRPGTTRRVLCLLRVNKFPLPQSAILSCIPHLVSLLLLACAVRPGPAQVTVEPVVEWTAPGDVAEVRWTGKGWAARLPAEGTVVYWPSDAPKDARPVRWSDERWQAPRAWAVTDGTAWLATATELLAFSEGSTTPSVRTAWPEGMTVWDDGRRLWAGHTSDDVRICTPGVGPEASECWSFPVQAVRPDFGLPAWDWAPPWWCGLRVGASDAGKDRRAELLCHRGMREGGKEPAGVAWRRSFRVPAGTDVMAVHVGIVPPWAFVSTGRWAWLWDLERGRLRWRLDLGASVTVRPARTAWDVLVVPTRGLLLYALDARSGNRLWVLPLRAPVMRMVLMQDAGCETQDTGCEGRGKASTRASAWVVLTLMDAPPTVVDVATGKTLWQATDWAAWDVASGDDSTVAWAGSDRKVRVFRIRPRPTVRAAARP